MTKTLDKEIWELIEHGDKTAYGECYIFYYKRLFDYGRKFTDNIALLEDSLQETLLSLWTGRDKLVHIHAPHSWLFGAFRHILFRKLRQTGRLRSIEGVPVAEPEFGIEHIIISGENDAEVRARLQQSISALTSRQREAIFLRFYQGLSYEEVAEMLGISVKATYKIMARALAELRASLSLPMLSLLLLLRNTLAQ